MASHITDDVSKFFTFTLLLIGCLTLLTFIFVPDIIIIITIIITIIMIRDIVQSGNVSREFGRHADG